MGGKGLEEAQVVVVECVQFFLAIESDEGAEYPLATRQRRHEGFSELPDDRVVHERRGDRIGLPNVKAGPAS